MSILWQNVIIGLVLAAAVAYLVVYYIRRRKRTNRCANCERLKQIQSTIKER